MLYDLFCRRKKTNLQLVCILSSDFVILSTFFLLSIFLAFFLKLWYSFCIVVVLDFVQLLVEESSIIHIVFQYWFMFGHTRFRSIYRAAYISGRVPVTGLVTQQAVHNSLWSIHYVIITIKTVEKREKKSFNFILFVCLSVSLNNIVLIKVKY